MSATSIYLDNAATTQPLPAVAKILGELGLSSFGNPSSSHCFGKEPHRLLEDARDFLRGSLGAASVVFTSGGTEADLLGIVGAARCRPPGRVLVGAADHPATLALGEMLEPSHRLVRVPVTEAGDLDPESLFELLGKDVRVVSILHGHNELGTLSDLDEIVGLVRKVTPMAHLHLDLVAAYGKIPFDLDQADVDSVAVSAHKLHGPRGIGFLALSSKARVCPLQKGGGQEGGLRGGTENVAGATALALAAEEALSHLAAANRHARGLAEQLCARLTKTCPGLQRLGHPTRRLSHILSLRLPGLVAETLQQRCSERGLAFSTGSACHDSRSGPNHVLEAIGLGRHAAREVARFSFCRFTTEEEVEQAADILAEEVAELLRISA